MPSSIIFTFYTNSVQIAKHLLALFANDLNKCMTFMLLV